MPGVTLEFGLVKLSAYGATPSYPRCLAFHRS